MKMPVTAAAALWLALCAPVRADPREVALAGPAQKQGDIAGACRPALLGGGGPADWRVMRAAGAAGGALIGDISKQAVDARYPQCFFDEITAGDIEISADITPITGEMDRAGGLIARAKDDANYYVVRANALEHNVRLYHVIAGVRRQFAGVERHVFSDRPQNLKLRAEGDLFTIWFDGKQVFQARDRALSGAGAAGLWTKADSVTGFSNVIVNVLKP